jgi:hypothetical protein
MQRVCCKGYLLILFLGTFLYERDSAVAEWIRIFMRYGIASPVEYKKRTRDSRDSYGALAFSGITSTYLSFFFYDDHEQYLSTTAPQRTGTPGSSHLEYTINIPVTM